VPSCMLKYKADRGYCVSSEALGLYHR